MLTMIVGAILIYVVFGDYIAAAAENLRQDARRKELENDKVEFGELYD